MTWRMVVVALASWLSVSGASAQEAPARSPGGCASIECVYGIRAEVNDAPDAPAAPDLTPSHVAIGVGVPTLIVGVPLTILGFATGTSSGTGLSYEYRLNDTLIGIGLAVAGVGLVSTIVGAISLRSLNRRADFLRHHRAMAVDVAIGAGTVTLVGRF